MMPDSKSSRHCEPQGLIEAMEEQSVLPLWERYKSLLTREPQSIEPFIWSWERMAPLVERAAREINMPDAERRVLLFSHPAFAGTINTSSTLSAGLQILNPGEVAPPHRHTIGALRMVMRGDGAETLTQGKACRMAPGDMILTPAWTWHEHRHNGQERMVWFDGLDYPLTRALGTMFFEPHPEPGWDDHLHTIADASLSVGGVLPADCDNASYSQLFRYPWESVNQVLEESAPLSDGSRHVRYVNPANGGPVMPTIDCFALRLGDGPTSAVRTSSTAIAVVIEGEGQTKIGDRLLDWRQHDIFTIPRWQWTKHCRSRGPATLFLMTDRAFLAQIGHLREEVAKVEVG